MTADLPGWQALLVDWTSLVRYKRDGFSEDDLARLVNRHGGVVDDTGGGVEVGVVRFQSAVKATATVTDEMIALWIGDEPYVDVPTEEVFAEEVLR